VSDGVRSGPAVGGRVCPLRARVRRALAVGVPERRLAADLFESFEVTLVAAIVLGMAAFSRGACLRRRLHCPKGGPVVPTPGAVIMVTSAG
jgi:hypothetical protein